MSLVSFSKAACKPVKIRSPTPSGTSSPSGASSDASSPITVLTPEVIFPSMFYKTADPNVVIWKSANNKVYACRVHDRSFIGELLPGTHYAVRCTVPLI